MFWVRKCVSEREGSGLCERGEAVSESVRLRQ